MKFALLVLALLAVSFTAAASDRPSLVSDDMSFCTPLDSLSPSATPEVVVTPCCGSEVALAAPALSVSDTPDDIGTPDERCDSAPDIDELVQICEIAYAFVLNEAERARPERYGNTSPSPLTDHAPGSTALHSRRSIRDLRHGPTAVS